MLEKERKSERKDYLMENQNSKIIKNGKPMKN